MDTAQDELIIEMKRLAQLAERLAAEIRRLTANIKSDIDECTTLVDSRRQHFRRIMRALPRDDEPRRVDTTDSIGLREWVSPHLAALARDDDEGSD